MNNELNLYRRNGKKVYIRQPKFSELSFVESLWSNKENMGEIGKTYSFPKEKWDMFYRKMVQPTDGKNFYCLIYSLDEKAIGEVSFHGYNSATKVARINIKIHHMHRRKGYGEEALKLLLEYYFFEFGGEAIIDTVSTKESRELLKKIGFEEISNFRNQFTYKITKKNFSKCKINNKKIINILTYDNINIMEYSIPFNIFSKANEILKEDYFEVHSISNKSQIETENINVSVKDIINNDMYKPNMIIIPGGKGVESASKDSALMNHLKSIYSNCDYIITFSNGIYFLNEFNDLEGITVPKSEWGIEGTIQIKKSFVDNGKLMFASNMIGIIELCTEIVKKIAGEEVSERLLKEIGIYN